MSDGNSKIREAGAQYVARQHARVEDRYNISDEELMTAQRSSDLIAALFSVGSGALLAALSIILEKNQALLMAAFGLVLIGFGIWIRVAQGSWANRVKQKSHDDDNRS